MSNNTTHEKVDFDKFADEYENLLKNQLSFFSGEQAYFSEYKIKVLKRVLAKPPSAILDFGAGIGLSLPHVMKHFPDAQISATDISEHSLSYIRRSFPSIEVIEDGALDGRTFDLILIITVLHHIEPKLRPAVMKRLASLLNPGGRLCIFEHNPYNPVTQRMVATCPFDTDAILLKRAESRQLALTNTGLTMDTQGYTLFFPKQLRSLRFAERRLEWLPLGGQYYVIAKRA